MSLGTHASFSISSTLMLKKISYKDKLFTISFLISYNCPQRVSKEMIS